MSDFWLLVFSSLYFILPAYLANALPVPFAKMNLPLGQAINKRVFGAHKTWRGFYAAAIGGLIMAYAQYYWQTIGTFESVRLIDYESVGWIWWGLLMGLGAITGDLVESYFKRKINIAPGELWFPFDQLDLIVGALIFTWPLYHPHLSVVLTIIIITPIVHAASNLLAYGLGLKKVWW